MFSCISGGGTVTKARTQYSILALPDSTSYTYLLYEQELKKVSSRPPKRQPKVPVHPQLADIDSLEITMTAGMPIVNWAVIQSRAMLFSLKKLKKHNILIV